jgi:xanthine dehydrogenase molybdopterin-binding subunit B
MGQRRAPFGVRTDVAQLLGVPLNRVRVLSTEIGGGFGGKASGIIRRGHKGDLRALAFKPSGW